MLCPVREVLDHLLDTPKERLPCCRFILLHVRILGGQVNIADNIYRFKTGNLVCISAPKFQRVAIQNIEHYPEGCRFSPRCDKACEKCRFSPRCDKACEKCGKTPPPLTRLPDGRKVRCWNYVGGESDE